MADPVDDFIVFSTTQSINVTFFSSFFREIKFWAFINFFFDIHIIPIFFERKYIEYVQKESDVCSPLISLQNAVCFSL